ncbi:hypothetical protein JNW88_11680 [Micromonospora sp. ATA32]|nr:hypothetical protein [Micromonospora sp. ATA32]
MLITGIMAAGKSTVAELLARRLPRSVHLREDIFRRTVVKRPGGDDRGRVGPGVAAARDRPKSEYGDWPVADLDAEFRAGTPRIGLWLDNSDQTPEQTVDEILARAWTEGRIG